MKKISSRLRAALYAIVQTDGYKLDHRRQYPQGTTEVYANWTARGSRIEGVNEVVFVGLQALIQRRLMEDFEEFFNYPDIDELCAAYQNMLDNYLGPNDIGTDHIRALWELGYIPLEFKALPEGTRVPIRCPMFTVKSTHDDFFWFVNYLETIISTEAWMPMTSATLAVQIREMMDSWALRTTGTTEGVDFLGHDFSMRGMAGAGAANLSAMGHLVAFSGTETVPVLQFIDDYYPFDGFLAGTVPATEHSVMCAGGNEDEIETFRRLMKLYPTALLSVVSDTWDYWNVLTNILPQLKDEIMARDGKLVIRPDSGDPSDIIAGTMWQTEGRHNLTPQEKGSIELLWDLFGGTVNAQGYKVLDSHIGLIYGDSMDYDRIDSINSRLERKGFASTNWVAGIGSFRYQYQTRDTFGFAMKSTNAVINGISTPIFKDPKTDSGLKKSLKGMITIGKESGRLVAYDDDQAELREEAAMLGQDQLRTVWKDGRFTKYWGFDEVRANVGLLA